jgi:hypothetical protein
MPSPSRRQRRIIRAHCRNTLVKAGAGRTAGGAKLRQSDELFVGALTCEIRSNFP